MPTIVVFEPVETTGETPLAVDSMDLPLRMRPKQSSSPATTSRDIEDLQAIGMFCGVGLLASLLLLAYGVDMSSELF
jgi:hypothetical protein